MPFNGKRLQQARELAGMTRADLANSTAQLEQFITLLEDTDLQPEADLTEALAHLLGFPPAFFFREDPPAFGRGSLDWH
jgi:ribosome-binding protein aMBF1 (putative translation factor)